MATSISVHVIISYFLPWHTCMLTKIILSRRRKLAHVFINNEGDIHIYPITPIYQAPTTILNPTKELGFPEDLVTDG